MSYFVLYFVILPEDCRSCIHPDKWSEDQVLDMCHTNGGEIPVTDELLAIGYPCL